MALRRWLFWCIVAVYVTVAVGGITRLTESGLSITEWKPISGVLPPMTDAGWDEVYAAFQAIPQAQSTHAGISLEGFKAIYWWEWFHRVLARGVGLLFAVPYLVFLLRRQIPPRLRARLIALPLLTAAQGVLGWYMVRSGLSERTEVSAYRLAAHLALALAILVIALWTWAELRPKAAASPPGPAPSRPWRAALWTVTVLIAVTIVSGAFVAGLRAGRIFNTFPLMGGDVVPVGYAALDGWWRNALENPVAAQFHHRVMAVLTGLAALVLAWRARAAHLGAGLARSVHVLGGVVLVQVGLGIVTLLLAVPVALGVVHQLVGVTALVAAVLALEGSRGAMGSQTLH